MEIKKTRWDKAFGWKKGDMIYYVSPKLMDTVPAEVIAISEYHYSGRVKEIKLFIRGDFRTGTKSVWVNPKHCYPQDETTKHFLGVGKNRYCPEFKERR